jgi:hypothetical protein
MIYAIYFRAKVWVIRKKTGSKPKNGGHFDSEPAREKPVFFVTYRLSNLLRGYFYIY